jgi:ribosome-associated protein
MKTSKSPSSKQLLKLTLQSLEDNKAFDVVSINLIGRSSIADYMIVASGNSSRQVTSMADNLVKTYKEIGLRPSSPEGTSNGDWVLIDAKDILIHIFRPEVRDFYSLEKMWLKNQDETSVDNIQNKI